MACKMVPSVITYNSLLRTKGKDYFSVNLSTSGHVICGLNGKVEIWDPEKSEIKYSTGVEGNMYDIKEYGNHLYGALKHDDQLTIVRYGRQLTTREDMVLISYKASLLSQIDVRYGKIAVTDWDNKLIELYTTGGEFVRDVQLNNVKRLRGVRLIKDDCLLVSDMESHSVTKYRTDGSGNIVWRRDDRLQSPAGICVNEWGFIFVCCNAGDKIYLLSPGGNFPITLYQLTMRIVSLHDYVLRR